MIMPDIVAEDLIIILFMAFAYDLILGEPPFAIHPVVWMGRLIAWLRDKAPSKHRKAYGVFLALVTMAFAATIACVVLFILDVEAIPKFLRLFIAAYFLKATFAVRCLSEAGGKVLAKLKAGKLDEARKEVSMYVSRDTSKLDENHISSAIIETTSENYVDGILSPLLFYAVFGPMGLVAAYIFKAASTLDSMVGYKDERHIELGYFSAKTDDVLNWLPARLSVLFIALAVPLVNVVSGKRKKLVVSDAFGLGMKEGLMTPSPNSGYPMASTAGALNVRLEKPNTYLLGGQYNTYPSAEDIWLTAALVLAASFLALAASVVLLYVIYGSG